MSESKITAKVSQLSELEGAAANNSEAVAKNRDDLENLRKEAGELEMQRHRLEGEKRSEYKEKCQKVKDNVFYLIKDGFPLDVFELDNWYKKIITSNHGLSDNTPPFDYMSIGHRQKMVNILIKYFLTYFHTTKETDIEFCKRFNRNISHIHIPIDKVVLESIYKNNIYRNKFQNRITKKGEQYYLDSKPWSRITDYESYSNFQNTIR